MPRVRRLRDPLGGPGFMPELGIEPHKTVFVSGIGCSGRFTYYMDTYGMHGIHGRAPALATGIAVAQPGSVGVGRHRRRRRALDRRQPPDPRAAPERGPQDPAVQQPDLRADEGPVLADERGGQGHQVDAVRLGRPPLQPDRARARRRGEVRRAHGRQRPSAPDRGASAGGRSTRAPRSSRSTRTATSSTTARSTCCATRRRASTTRSGWCTASRSCSTTGTRCVARRATTAGSRSRQTARPMRTASSCTTRTGGRRSRSRSPTCRSGPTSRRASACSARWSDRSTARRCGRRSSAATERSARATSAKLLRRRRHLGGRVAAERLAARCDQRARGPNRASASEEASSTPCSSVASAGRDASSRSTARPWCRATPSGNPGVVGNADRLEDGGGVLGAPGAERSGADRGTRGHRAPSSASRGRARRR